jgi:hypothetical protein
MPMLVISGSFQIEQTQPNGDSMRFYPNDPKLWDEVEGENRVQPNRRGGAQLRFDGIDALETHYPIPGGPLPPFGNVVHQPLPLGHRASEWLLRWAGFYQVTRDANETVTDATPDTTDGYILTRGADKYGRCVALVGRGTAPKRSGTFLSVTVQHLRDTANYGLLLAGLAYPTYYRKLYWDLREAMTRAVLRAWPTRGVWRQDSTESGATIRGPADLFDRVVILPKLFRRLVDYLQLNDGDTSLSGFTHYLAQKDDRLYVRSLGRWTGFDNVIEVRNQTVRLMFGPEDLVFDEG